jgi:hypothetical protein
MITKVDDHKIKRQTNIETFKKNYNNFIESKMKQIMKLNSQSVPYQKMK